jgi:hypothetical protein
MKEWHTPWVGREALRSRCGRSDTIAAQDTMRDVHICAADIALAAVCADVVAGLRPIAFGLAPPAQVTRAGCRWCLALAGAGRGVVRRVIVLGKIKRSIVVLVLIKVVGGGGIVHG